MKFELISAYKRLAYSNDIPDISGKVSKSGDTMSGALTAPAFMTVGGTASQVVRGDGGMGG